MSMRKRLGAVLFVVCMIASCVSVITNPLKVKGAGTLIEEIAVTVEIPKVNSTQTDVKVEVPVEPVTILYLVRAANGQMAVAMKFRFLQMVAYIKHCFW